MKALNPKNSRLSASLPEVRRSHYRILGLVGQGQYGQVYCGIHRQQGTLVALKHLDPQRFPTQKFLRELRFLVSLRHPNIVSCQALERSPRGRYLVLDYCEGGTLRQLMHTNPSLSLPQRLELVADILSGLAHAHEHGIVHCDIKPENILLQLSPGGWVARIADFGVAKLSQELGQQPLSDTGSPAYMAPERFYGRYSCASDLYAVGILLYELLVGERPFSGLPEELMAAHLNQAVLVPATVPFLLRSVILTVLQKLPHRRFASAGEMLKAIRLATEVLRATQTDPLNGIMPPILEFAPDLPGVVHQEPLSEPVTALGVRGREVLQARATQVHCQTYRQQILTGEILQQQRLPFPDPVTFLAHQPQGWVIGTRSLFPDCSWQQLYLLPASPALDPLTPPQTLLSRPAPEFLGSSDPQGRWLPWAAPLHNPDQPQQYLGFEIFDLSGRVLVRAGADTVFPDQLLALDQRHGLAIFASFPMTAGEPFPESGTQLKFFSRRTGWMGALNLPIALHRAVVSAVEPFRLLALDRLHPTLGYLIDLKPLRIQRLALGMIPDLISATPWGFVLADRQGNLVLLNSAAEFIDHLNLPGCPTAIAACDDYGLLVATWTETAGVLYTLDLQAIRQRQMNQDWGN